jgi:hypothetical protein
VRRLTDRLTVVEHRAATRLTEVDISLSMLDPEQREASSLFQDLRSRSPSRAPGTGAVPTDIWVPVTRISRSSVAPIDIYDANGALLPRLTQFETSRLLASGMYRLLRSILEGLAVPGEQSDLSRLLYEVHESRWTVQYALATLLGDRNRPQSAAQDLRDESAIDGYGARRKTFALRVLRSLEGELSDYYSLLDVALNDYLLVVALPAAQEEHMLRYEAPLHVGQVSWGTQRLSKAFRANNYGYVAEYRGQISPNLRAYHVVVNSEPGVDIEPLYLSTNADALLAERLRADLETLADTLAEERAAPTGSPASKMLELQMQTTLRRLADLVRRRRWAASQATTPWDASALTCERLAQAAVSGVAVASHTPGIADNSILRQSSITPSNLRQAAAEIEDLDFAWDFSLENDPTSNRAHAYWRRQTAPDQRENLTQIEVHSAFRLRDSTASGPRSVAWYATAVAVIAYCSAGFLTGEWWPFSPEAMALSDGTVQSDAVVAVLLLVPGFLYTLLSFPSRHTVGGRLRVLPAMVARACIGVMAVLAAAVAGGLREGGLAVLYAVAVGLPLAGAALLLYRRREPGLGDALTTLGAPRWVGGRRAGHPVHRVPPDAEFYSSGVQP